MSIIITIMCISNKITRGRIQKKLVRGRGVEPKSSIVGAPYLPSRILGAGLNPPPNCRAFGLFSNHHQGLQQNKMLQAKNTPAPNTRRKSGWRVDTNFNFRYTLKNLEDEILFMPFCGKTKKSVIRFKEIQTKSCGLSLLLIPAMNRERLCYYPIRFPNFSALVLCVAQTTIFDTREYVSLLNTTILLRGQFFFVRFILTIETRNTNFKFLSFWTSSQFSPTNIALTLLYYFTFQTSFRTFYLH